MIKIRRIDLYPDDFLTGTYMLDDTEFGLYARACLLIYATGGPITIADLRAISKSHGHAFSRCLNKLISLGKLIEHEKTTKTTTKTTRKISHLEANGSQTLGERSANARKTTKTTRKISHLEANGSQTLGERSANARKTTKKTTRKISHLEANGSQTLGKCSVNARKTLRKRSANALTNKRCETEIARANNRLREAPSRARSAAPVTTINHQSTIPPKSPTGGLGSKMNGEERKGGREPAYGPVQDPVALARKLGIRK